MIRDIRQFFFHSEHLTYKRDGLREKLGQVLAPVIRDGDLLIFKLAGIFKEIRQVGGDVQDVFNAKLF